MGISEEKKKKKKSIRIEIPRISQKTAYQKGRRFEYRVKKYYETLGWYVKRSYASKGAEDLIAVKKIYVAADRKTKPTMILSKVLHIQCKNLTVEKPLNQKERNNLLALCRITGGKAMHVFNRNHKLIFEEIV